MPVPAPGMILPGWEITVSPEPMKLYAALARDPTPIHWDRSGGPVINQGPLNVGYVANMLMAWAGPESIRELAVRFTDNVLEGEIAVAGGVVTAVDDGVAECEVWLDCDGRRALDGTATVVLPTAG